MRKETKEAFDRGDYIERLLIALYVYHGWDRLWLWAQVPAWLWSRYDPSQYRNHGR